MISEYEYLATCIDLEGHITLSGRQRKYSSSIHYTAVISIDNLSKPILEHIQQKIKFGHIIKGSRLDSGAQMWRWITSRIEIQQYLPLIEPFLIIKQKQAQLLIEACQILKSKQETGKMFKKKNAGEFYTIDEYNQLENIFQQMKYLNGKSTTKNDPLTDAEKLLRELRRR